MSVPICARLPIAVGHALAYPPQARWNISGTAWCSVYHLIVSRVRDVEPCGRDRFTGEGEQHMNSRHGPGGRGFDAAYQGIPPWDIGHPQQAYVELAHTGQINGSVLDVGCGTGEHALYLAQWGHEVWGIDSSPTAIQKAQTKASARGINVTFRVADAFNLQDLGRTFETIIDSGLFHVFSDEERPLFVKSLVSVLQPGGTYYLLCFSDRESSSSPGPRRVSQAEIEETFQQGWHVNDIRATRFETTFQQQGVAAWLASMTRW